MLIKIIFAGFGGQGVLMMGYSFAHSAMNQGYYVTYLPSYGAEVRGGTANCTVALSDEEIASPVASQPDYLVILNNPSVYTFQNRIASGGTFFLNSSIITVRPSREDVELCWVPAGEIAEKLGSTRVINTAMLGAFIKKTGFVTADNYLNSLADIIGESKKSLIDVNRRAFMAGYEFIN
jgi:2-oxoglutarate ferredoxin oxidoreductase subunit gamma